MLNGSIVVINSKLKTQLNNQLCFVRWILYRELSFLVSELHPWQRETMWLCFYTEVDLCDYPANYPIVGLIKDYLILSLKKHPMGYGYILLRWAVVAEDDSRRIVTANFVL